MAVDAGVSLLVVGPASAALSAVESLLRRPVLVVDGGAALALPEAGWAGTILLHDVDRLAPADQLRLLHWLDLAGRQAQIVSTVRASLLPLVEAGQFLEALFYRLNMVCLDMTSARPEPRVEQWPGGERLFATLSFDWPPRA